jgi:phosphoribosyl 1,2-cyclic phosphate phosphodiesterase
MRLLFLGTGAAEGNPAAYCGCASCREVRAQGPASRNLRMRASLRVGDRAQIDFGPDGYSQMLRHGVDLRSLEHLFVTHSHADHFDLGEIVSKGMARDANPAPLHLHVSQGLASWLERNRGAVLEWLDVPEQEAALFAEQFPVHPLVAFAAHAAGEIVVEPVEAAHRALRGGETALNYLLRLPDGIRVHYACDTGWYGEQTWEYLAGRRVDILVMESTFGGRGGEEHPYGHLDCRSFAAMLERMGAIGFVGSETRVFATHLNPHQGLDHEGLQAWFDGRGLRVTVAWDGMAIESARG